MRLLPLSATQMLPTESIAMPCGELRRPLAEPLAPNWLGVFAVGGELLDPVMARVGDPDVAGGVGSGVDRCGELARAGFIAPKGKGVDMGFGFFFASAPYFSARCSRIVDGNFRKAAAFIGVLDLCKARRAHFGHLASFVVGQRVVGFPALVCNRKATTGFLGHYGLKLGVKPLVISFGRQFDRALEDAACAERCGRTRRLGFFGFFGYELRSLGQRPAGAPFGVFRCGELRSCNSVRPRGRRLGRGLRCPAGGKPGSRSLR